MEDFCGGTAFHILDGRHPTKCFMDTVFSGISFVVTISMTLYVCFNIRRKRFRLPEGRMGEVVVDSKYTVQDRGSLEDIDDFSPSAHRDRMFNITMIFLSLMPFEVFCFGLIGFGGKSTGAGLLYSLSHALSWITFSMMWTRARYMPFLSSAYLLIWASIGVFWIFWGIQFGAHKGIAFWVNACGQTPIYLILFVAHIARIRVVSGEGDAQGQYHVLGSSEYERNQAAQIVAEKSKRIDFYNQSIPKFLFFWFLAPLLQLGRLRQINQDDLPPCDPVLKIDSSLSTFKKHWDDIEDAPSIKKKFIWALWRTTRRNFLTGMSFGTVSSICLLVQPFLLERFIAHLGGEPVPWAHWGGAEKTEGYVLSFLLVITSVVQQLADIHNWRLKLREGVRARGITIAFIYDKLLLMSAQGKQKVSDGKIVNTISTDAQRIEWVYYWSDSLWNASLQFLGTIFILYYILGWAAFVGAGVIFILFPLQSYLYTLQMKITRKQMKFTDERMEASREFLLNARVIKFYVWEKYFRGRIMGAREKEMAKIAAMSYLNATMTFVGTCMPALMSLAAFTAYALASGKDLKPSQAITSLSLFNNLKGPLFLIPNALQAISAAMIAMERVSSVLNADEVGERQIISNEGPIAESKAKTMNKDSAASPDVLEAKSRSTFADEANESLLRPSDNTNNTPEVSERFLMKPQELRRGEIKVEDVDIYFDKKDGDLPVLPGLELEIKSGTLNLCVGAFGAGKSVLLTTLLGETYHTRSKWLQQRRRAMPIFTRQGSRIAYVPQTAWVLNDTIRNNILFGAPYDAEHYRETIIACGLAPDLDSLKAGDETEVGERGVTLSGGQKQRVSLARAVYIRNEVEYFLFDDPLSALDAHVGQWVFDRVFVKMLAGKTRVIVTHQLQHITKADRILVMESNTQRVSADSKERKDIGKATDEKASKKKRADTKEGKSPQKRDDGVIDVTPRSAREGRPPLNLILVEHGTFEELMDEKTSTGVFRQMMIDYEGQDDLIDEKEMEQKNLELGMEPRQLTRQSSEEARKMYRKMQERSIRAKDDGKLVEEEERAVGAVEYKIYLSYMNHMGWKSWLFLVFLIAGVLISYRVSDIWLSIWSSHDGHTEYYLIGYAGINFVTLVITLGATFTTAFLSVGTSRSVHRGVINALLGAPMAFYDTTPTGRIANRLSRDQDVVDTELANGFYFTIRSFCQVSSMAIVICVIIVYFGLVLVPVGTMFYFIMQYFRSTSRELQRLDSTSKSPIFSHLSATLGGLTSIRGYKAQQRFTKQMHDKVEDNMRAFWTSVLTNLWLSTQLNLLFCGVLVIVTILSVLLRIDAGQAGLCITYGFAFCFWVQAAIKAFTRLEMNMNTIERTGEYAELTPEGDSKVAEGSGIRKGWPEQGRIEFRDIGLRYRPGLPLILKNLNVTVEAHMKVGVCGRTGAGKSSLMAMLFRLAEPEGKGCFIDGIDVRKLHLHDLRRGVGVIPQDPTIFKASIRSNLDPYMEYSDDQLLDALRVVQMLDYVNQQEAGLDHELTSGESLSVGQRQLLCVARAILRKPKVLILDEATASIDYATDKLIQSTIATEFKDVTVLTIAHRIDTIIDYDRILVLKY